MALDFNVLMGRDAFFDQSWFAGSPYRQHLANIGYRGGAAPGIRQMIIADKNDKMYNDAWRQDFNARYTGYVNLFNQRQAVTAAQQENEAKNRETVANLEAQQALRIDTLRSVGNAVSSSLRILGQQSSLSQAPTAAMTPRKKGADGPRSSSASLRIGSTASRTGTNLAV